MARAAASKVEMPCLPASKNWSRNCPLKGRQRPAAGGGQPSSNRPTTAMFFVEPSAQSLGYLTMSAPNPAEEQYMSDFQPDTLAHHHCSYLCFSSPSQPPHVSDVGDFLSYNFATATETPGRALVERAAQHGLIGQETLSKLDQHLANQFGMRIKHTNEDGGTVRGVCGSEERTPIAYIPIGIGGCSGLLRVQIVPGAVPCLLPAYLLTDMGSVIDMVGLNMYHTTLGVTQQMHRRATGHVEVCIAEYGKGFHMPSSASFGKSQVWSGGPIPTPIRTADASISMLASMETLLLALALGGLDAGYQLVALERQVYDKQQKEAALLEASRKTAATKGPTRKHRQRRRQRRDRHRRLRRRLRRDRPLRR